MSKKKKVSKDYLNRQVVREEFDADTTRLYGSLDEAIAYLQEIKASHPKARLEEDWCGYEDMKMVFAYTRDETDEEYNFRIEEIRVMQELQRKAEQAEAEHKEKLAKLAAYKKQLGL